MAIDFFDPKDIQRLYDAEDKEIAAFVAKLKNKIERYLLKISKEIEGGGSKLSLQELTLALSKLSVTNLPPEIKTQLFEISGLYQTRINTLEDAFKQVANVSKIFTDGDGDIISQIISRDTAQITTTIDQTFNQFKQTSFRGLVGGGLPDLRELTAAITDNLESKLPSEMNTQLAAFQRSVTLQKAESLELRHFLYAGGLIKTSREFCRERAGKIYSIEEAATWDNEQSLPVIPYLGGYNCRHSMVFMSLEKARDNGYTGE